MRTRTPWPTWSPDQETLAKRTTGAGALDDEEGARAAVTNRIATRKEEFGMRALLIEHDHVSPPGLIGHRLRQHRFEIVEHLVVPESRFDNPNVTTPFPDVHDFDLIVPMGAPWPAYDTERVGSWVTPELDLLREADQAGIPVLGICFGGQLLALAHGGSVEPASRPELGWTTIETDNPRLIPSGPWFQWHFDRWNVPPDAVEIARDDVASQAFVLRKNLAVQFHPELNAGTLDGWLRNGGDEQLRHHDIDPDEVMAQTIAEDHAATIRTGALVDEFLAMTIPWARTHHPSHPIDDPAED